MFRVLALDGGGIKGAFSAAALAELEARTDRPVRESFDLLVGTSTGGILALALAAGKPAAEVEALYRDKALEIFPEGSRTFEGWFEWWFEPKYSSSGLEVALKDTFGAATLGELETRVAIPAFDAVGTRPLLFRSPPLDPQNRAHDMTLVDVALATSAAPTYFTAAKVNERVLLDGGIWANCPVLVGIAEAMSTCERLPHTISVLSVGTTSEPFSLSEKITEGGKLRWAGAAVTLFMRASKLGALDTARKFCGSLVRVDEYVQPGRFDLDDPKGVNALIELGHQSVEREWPKIKELLVD